MITRYLMILFGAFFILVSSIQVVGQFTPAEVEISEVKETVAGKVFFLHSVKENQTLFGIARKYGVSTATIIEANPNHPDISKGINIGQIIRVPAQENSTSTSKIQASNPSSTSPASPRQVTSSEGPIKIEKSSRETSINGVDFYIHTVEQGQTLFSIGRAYRVSTLKIAEANPNYPELLKGINLGQELLIPKIDPATPPTPPITSETPWPVGLMKDEGNYVGDVDCSGFIKKQSFNVALFIPLFLDRFSGSSSDMPRNHDSFTFLPYYQGVLVALDSITKKGADITLHTYDLGKETSKARELLLKPEMNKMDLIIGPFYQETLNIIVPFAKERGISVVSPLLPGNDQLADNPNLFQAVPSTQNQLVKLAGFLKNRHSGQNIILAHNNVSEGLPLIRDFKLAMGGQPEGINGSGDTQHGYFLNGSFVGSRKPDNTNITPPPGAQASTGEAIKEIVLGQGGTVAQLVNLLEPNRTNVIVAPVGNEVMVANMMRELNARSNKNIASPGQFDILLIGISRWEDFQTIDPRTLTSLNVHILSTDFVDTAKTNNRNFSRRFRSLFLEAPNSHAFWGVQTSYLFFDLLNKYGKDFATCIERSNESGRPLVHYERLGQKENGWVNSNLILYKFDDLEKKCALSN